MKFLRSTLTSSLFLKVSSLILGFGLWSIMNDLFTQSKWFTIPVCFYNTESHHIKAPETVTLELTGKRAHLKRISSDTLAVHVDAKSLQQGDNLLRITHDLLLLPQTLAVTTVIPQSVIVHLQSGVS